MAEKTERKKYTKSNLPTKICPACKKPFAWRKKWETVWKDVKFCSKRCRGDNNAFSRTEFGKP